MPPVSLSPRSIFDPYADSAAAAVGPGAGWRAVPRAFRAYYQDRLSWFALAVSSVILCYGGGLLMFWFHSVELGEGGPAISWQAHWLLDSTFGFLALTPLLVLIMPIAVAWSTMLSRPDRPGTMLISYAVIAGGLFALATTPGPIFHDQFVGRGTWLADQVTQWIGDPSAPLPPISHYPVSAALTQQLGFGIALYMSLALVSVLLIRAAIGRAGRRVPAMSVSATE